MGSWPQAGRFVAAVAVASSLVVGMSCGPDGPAPPVASEARPAGHVRMVALLAELDAAARVDNPFVGEAPIPQATADLAALPAVPDLRRWLLHRVLGKHTLRLGRYREAIDHLDAANAELAVFPGEIPRDEQIATIVELGVAWLRLGETENCQRRHTPDSCILPIRGGGIHVDAEPARQAMHHLQRAFERTRPGEWWHVKIRWLLTLAAMAAGDYPDGVPEDRRIPPAAFAAGHDVPRLLDVAHHRGLARFDLAGGAIAEDFDGDGRLDLLVSTSDPAREPALYRGAAGGAFEEVPLEQSGLAGITGGLNMVHADYDNDGDADVLVLRGAWWRQGGRHPNSLLQNDGRGRFTDVTFEAGLGVAHWPTQTAAWADYDLDGDLDLYVGNEADPNVPAAGQLFRNEGDGTFVDVAAAAGVENLRYAKGVAWGDVDGDRDPDLFVSNLGGANRLYRNEGDGTFVDIAAAAGVTRPLASFPTWFWDYDNDGVLDLWVAAYGGPNLPPDVGYVAAEALGLDHAGERPVLYRGHGDGRFTDVSAATGADRTSLPMGANFGDLDGDGWLDYYLGTGYPYFEGLMPNLLYLGRDGTRFDDVTFGAGVGHLQKGHGVVFADLDDDGDVDLFEQVGGMYPGDEFGNVWFDNPGFGNRFIELRLRGTRSNASAIGARIDVIVASDDGVERRIHRVVSSGGSFGANPLRQRVGVGRAARLVAVEVYWPASDLRQRFETLALDRAWTIVEGEAAPVAVPRAG